MSGQQSCYFCDKKGDMKRCAGCQHAFYCGRSCQRGHWRRHKPNCIPPNSSLHELVKACVLDVWPSPPAAVDYGFFNLRQYHGNVLFPDGTTAEHVLLGLYEMIMRELSNNHRPTPGAFIASSIGASKKMMLEAYEKNALDELIQRFIKNVYDNCGDHLRSEGNYCTLWLQNKLVIGPTRLLLSDSVCLTQDQILQMRNDIHQTYYGATE